MPKTIIYHKPSRTILVISPPVDGTGAPILPTGVDAAVTSISDTEAAKFSQPSGGFTLDPDGQTVIVAPVPPPNPIEVERQGSISDLSTTATAALARLDDIIANGATYTAAQTRDAVLDEARVLRRLLRLLRSLVT
jgi:hypothetical protein